MATLTNGVSALTGEITVTKQLNTILTLATNGTYVDKDVQFSIGVLGAAAAANTAAADADVVSTDDGSIGGVNISGVIGDKQTTEPSSGYYIRIDATGSGSSKITTAGWINAGALDTASTTATKYFPVQAAQVAASGTNTVSPSASVSGSNVTLSNTDNGISVTATGGGTASATATVTGSQAGYIPAGETLDSTTINAPSASTTAASFISGVTLNAPASGTRSFTITVPNGDSTQTITFTVDSDRNVTIS